MSNLLFFDSSRNTVVNFQWYFRCRIQVYQSLCDPLIFIIYHLFILYYFQDCMDCSLKLIHFGKLKKTTLKVPCLNGFILLLFIIIINFSGRQMIMRNDSILQHLLSNFVSSNKLFSKVKPFPQTSQTCLLCGTMDLVHQFTHFIKCTHFFNNFAMFLAANISSWKGNTVLYQPH